MNKLIIANQKNCLKYGEVKTFLEEINGRINKDFVIFCPSMPYFVEYINQGYQVAAQDVSLENRVVTGEVNAQILSSLSIHYVLIGHTERRVYKKETLEDIVLKIKNAVACHLCPIVGIGEMEEKESFVDLEQSVRKIFDSLSIEEKKHIWISYEPVYAIGTNISLDPLEINEKIGKLKKIILEEYGVQPKMFYGGSVSTENVKSILQLPYLDGILVGKLSCDSRMFLEFIEVAVTL